MSVLNPAKERALTKHIGSVSQVLVFPSFVLGRLLGSPTWINFISIPFDDLPYPQYGFGLDYKSLHFNRVFTPLLSPQ